MTGKDTFTVKPADLPAPPQAALKILRACSRKDINNSELAELATHDPVLSTELLRIVNSAFFSMPSDIKSVTRAVNLLGQRALRNLVLCISVRDSVRQNALPDFDISSFWEDTLRHAVAARLLAEHSDLDDDECFTAGLLQDFGLLVMCFLQPSKASVWHDLRKLDPDQRYEREQQVFGITHDNLLQILGRSWSLPDELCAILGTHHDCKASSLSDADNRMCKILYLSDWMTAIFNVQQTGDCLRQYQSLANELLGLTLEQADTCLAAMPAMVESSAVALGLHIQQQPDFEDILSQANERLAEENMSYQELTWKLENALAEQDRLAAALDRELQVAREIQTGLLPSRRDSRFPVIGYNHSALELSGDFFDFFELPDGRIYFNLGDVSGKGVTAALLMAKTCSLFRCLGKREHDPARLLSTVNDELAETMIRGMFVTLTCGLYDPATDQVQLVNAGHPPALLISKEGEITELSASGPPLGIMAGSQYTIEKTSLSGGCLYLFSDGLIECEYAPDRVLGVSGLAKLLHKLHDREPDELIKLLFSQFIAQAETLKDDITLVMVEKRTPHA
ncbi:MAG TPA: HDOD domain-containing protein [Gammaproteobacteria bacterium]|nr:HDOD domain-containing protein [Gammaproteobacteria bacterium]